MFRITEDPSSGSLVQYLTKNTRMVLSCPLRWTWSVLWQHTLTRCVRVCVRACVCVYVVHCVGSAFLCSEHDRTILVILAKYCTRLPDDGSSLIRNMLEHF